MTEIEVILQKLPKSAKNGKNLPILNHKIQNFEFSPQLPLLIHATRHLGEHLGSFQPKIMTKLEVMLQKLQICQKIDYKVRAGRPIS